MKTSMYTVRMNIIAYRKAALLRRSGAMQDSGMGTSGMGTSGMGAASSRGVGMTVKGDGAVTDAAGACRVYRETVIVDDGQILIGVPTGDSDLIPRCLPAG